MQSQLVMTCAVCAREAVADAAFCSRCGSRLQREQPVEPSGRTSPVPAARRRSRGGPPTRVAGSRAAEAASPPGTSGLASLMADLDPAAPPSYVPAGLEVGTAPFDERGIDLREDRSRAGRSGEDDPEVWYDDEPAPSLTTTGQWAVPSDAGRVRRRVPVVPVVLALVALLLAGGIAALLVKSLHAGQAVVVPTGSAPAAGAAASGAAPASSGAASASTGTAAVTGATVTAPASSPDSRDAAGDRTSYAPSQALDGDPTTAWRMDGNGAGATLTITFVSPRTLTRLGLVNGYAKVDPDSGADRYAQERRITHVTWTVGGRSYAQGLTDGDRSAQVRTIPSTSATTVVLHLDTTTAPGQAAFDKTAISDLVLGS